MAKRDVFRQFWGMIKRHWKLVSVTLFEFAGGFQKAGPHPAREVFPCQGLRLRAGVVVVFSGFTFS